MAKRTVTVSAIKYAATDGSISDGFQGDEVDVHDDYLARFDTLNTFDYGKAEQPQPESGDDDASMPPARRGRKPE